MFKMIEESIFIFVRNEMKKLLKVLNPYECTEEQDEEVVEGEDEEQMRSSREAFLKITLNFLRKFKHDELAESLQSSMTILMHPK